MQRLSGLDSTYLYTQTAALHMHTLKIAVLDVSEVPGGYTFDRFTEVLSGRLHLLPPFRRRVVMVPGSINHPVWIEDEHFRLDQHLRRVTAPAPGGPRQFDAVISEIASAPLAMDRPLWEIWVVEGLEGDHLGFVAKIHHTAADGVAASALLANVMSVAAGEIDVDPPAQPWVPEPVPSKPRLVADALRDLLLALLRLPSLVRATASGMRRLKQAKAEAADLPPSAFDGPRTSFNGPLTPRRSFGTISLPIDDFRKVKSAFGCTINDVVLSVVAGSVRTYLAKRGEVYDRPLVTAVPISSDAPDTVRLWGNKVSNIFTTLRTDIADPVERLQVISRVMSTAKEFQNALGVDTMERWVEYTPPKPYALLWKTILPRMPRPPINCIVSNVPGPREPLYIAGGKMTGLYSVGPIMEGVGLNVTVWSYLDSMNFSALTCPDLLSDVHEITDGLADALQELLKAAAA